MIPQRSANSVNYLDKIFTNIVTESRSTITIILSLIHSGLLNKDLIVKIRIDLL